MPSVVIVDDSREITAVIALALKVMGYRPVTVSSGDLALTVITEHQPEFALIDLCLPGINGWDIARCVRAAPLARQPLLVAMTGLTDPILRVRSLTAGFNEHLLKPIGVDDLRRVLALPSP